MNSIVEFDDDLMAEAIKVSGLRSKRQAIEEGLRLLVRVRGQESIRSLRGVLNWEGPFEQMRRTRSF